MKRPWSSFANFPNCCSDSRLDEFCARLLDFKRDGVYVDIGSAQPMYHNNSHFLETQLGWRGLCVELDGQYSGSYGDRKNCSFINGDATQVDYAKVFAELTMPSSIDFLSIDVDGPYVEVAKMLPHDNYRFKVIGIEHDAYVHGDKYRAPEREFFLGKGYVLACADMFVRHPDYDDCPYEDWYLDPQYFSNDVIEKVKSSSCYGDDVMAKLV
jgi:hypothetical protein